VADEFAAPTFANMIEGGRTPYLPADTVGYTDVKMFDTPGYRNSSRDDSRRYEDLAAIGFDIVVYPLFAATRALQGAYGALAADGTAEAAETVDFDAVEEAIDAPAYRERERRYPEESADE
jgi:2-methylisocitrate lyase-like PEP mutase family enzyme